MSDLQTQIVVSADSTGVASGLEPGKAAMKSFAQSAKLSGSEAGQGMDNAAKKTAEATERQIKSLKLLTAEFESGGRSTRQYQEALASIKGNNLDALKPYLDQLDAVKAKQLQANQAIGQANPALEKVGISARQTAAALRGVPAQFTDIVVSLQGGQAPLTVLLQQGGQLKDMFGGIGNATQALGGYIAGLVNPFTIAAAAAVGLGYVISKGQTETTEYAKAIILSGNAAGVTSGQLQDYAQAISKVSGTQGAAAEAVTAFAASGQVGAENLQQFAQAAIKFEKTTGTAVGETVKQFAELGKSPVQASIKLNEQFGYLTVSTYKQIKALEDQGRATDAADLAQKTFADTIASRSGQIVENTGSIARAWNSVKSAISQAGDALLNVGRASTSGDKISGIKAEILELEQVQSRSGKSITGRGGVSIGERSNFDRRDAARLEGLKASLGVLEKTQSVEQEKAKSQAQQNELAKQFIEYGKQGAAFETKSEKLKKEVLKATIEGDQLVKAGLITQLDLNTRLSNIREKFKEAPKAGKSGSAATGENEVASLKARIAQESAYFQQLKQRGAQAEKLGFFEQASIKIQNELQTSISGSARAQKEKALAIAQSGVALEKETSQLKIQIGLIEKAKQETLKQAEAVDKSAEGYRQQAEDLNAANAVFGSGKIAVAEYRLEQTKLLALMADSSDSFSPAYVASLNNQVVAQKDFVDALKRSEFKDFVGKQQDAKTAIEALSQSYQDEAAVAGLSFVDRSKIVALRKIELDRVKEIIAIEKSGLDQSEQQQLKDVANQNSARLGQVETAKITSDEYKKTADSINQSLTDALLGASKKGESFFKSLGNSIKDIFRKMVLEPTIKSGVSSLTSAIGLTGSSGGGGGKDGGLFSGGNLSTLISAGSGYSSTVNTLAGIFGAGTTAGASAASLGYANAVGALGGDALGAFIGSNASWAAVPVATTAVAAVPLAAGAVAAPVTTTGFLASATAALGAIPVWGWAALAAVAAVSLLKGGETRLGASYETDAFGKAFVQQGPSGGEISGDAARAAFDFTTQTIKDTLKTVGSKAVLTDFTAGLESSKNNKGFDFAGGKINGVGFGEFEGRAGEQFAYKNQDANAAFANYITQLKQATVEALQATTDLPKTLQNKLSGIDAKTLDTKALDALLSDINEFIGSIKGFQTAALALPFENLKNLSFEAAADLAEFGGGLEKLKNNLGVYFDNFYSKEEQRAQKVKEINAVTAGSGLDAASATRDSFKSLVNSQDLTTASGRQTYASLLSVAGALSALLPPADEVKKAVNEMSDLFLSLGKESAQLQADLIEAKGDSKGANFARKNLATQGFSDAELEIYNFNEALREQIKTAKSAGEAARELDQRLNEFAKNREVLTADLLEAQGDKKGAKYARREIDIAGLDKLAVVQYDYNASLRDQIEAVKAASVVTDELKAKEKAQTEAVLSEGNGLQEQINALRDTETEAIERQRNALDESNKNRFDELQSLRKADAIKVESKGLQDQLNSITDTATEALTRQRNALDESNRALFDQIQTQNKANATAAEAKSLQDQLNVLTDTLSQSLERQRDALDKSNRSLFDQVQAETQRKAAIEASNAAMQSFSANIAGTISKFSTPEENRTAQYNSIASRLKAAGLSSSDYESLASDLQSASKDKIKAVAQQLFNGLGDGAGVAKETLRALVDQLGDLKNTEASEAIAATTSAIEKRNKSQNDAMGMLEKSVSVERKAAEIRASLAAQNISSIKSIFDLLKSNVNDLYSIVESTRTQSGIQGNAFIDNALLTAKSSGYLPEQAALADAISASRKNIDSFVFATQKDEDVARLELAGKLSQLKDISGEQLTEAERQAANAKAQLDYFDNLLINQKAQLEALQGLNTSVLSVPEALAALLAAKTSTPTPSAPSSLTSAPTPASTSAVVSSGTTGLYQANDDTINAMIYGTRNRGEEGNRQLYDWAYKWRNSGVTLARLNEVANVPAGTAEEWAKANGLPLFANGGTHTGGWAMVGERGPELAYMPPARIYNTQDTSRILQNQGGSDQAIVKLTEEITRLGIELARISKNTENTSDILDKVTDRGNAMITSALA